MNYNLFMSDIRDLTINELTELITQLNEPKFRAKQLYEWLHVHNASSYNQMTNLPKTLRNKLSETFPLEQASVIDKEVSQDGTRKYVLEFSDGNTAETVAILSNETHDEKHPDLNNNYSASTDLKDLKDETETERLTVCFSTQSGCPMACEFCATGKEGFSRNLTASEMVSQIITASEDTNLRVSNVVAMGQGEPFLNYDQLLVALRRLNTDPGIEIGARKITVSTCGIIDGILRFIEEPEQFRLAVSLHSAVQKTRNKLMPHLVNQPLNDLKDALLKYNQFKGRRVTLEYMLIKDINDSKQELLALIDFCVGLKCHVNLLPLNSIDGSKLNPSPKTVMDFWIKELELNSIPVSVRHSKGADISGACGQLKARSNKLA